MTNNWQKQKGFFLFAILLVSLFSSLLIINAPTVKAEGTNLVLNPSFEDGVGDNATYWGYTVTSTAISHRVNTEYHTGSWSYEFWANASASCYSDYLAVTEGTSYAFDCWIKTLFPIDEAGPGFYIAVMQKNGTTETTNMVINDYVKTTQDWGRYTVAFTVPEGYDYSLVRIRLNFGLTTNTGNDGATVWTDDFSIKALPAANYESGNLIGNPDFETGVDDSMSGWAAVIAANLNYTVYRSNTQAQNGTYSLETYTIRNSVNVYSEYFDVTEDYYYYLTFYAMTNFSIPETGTGYTCALQIRNTTNVYTIAYSTFVKTNTSWTQYTVLYQVPSGYSYTQMRVRVTLSIPANFDLGAICYTDNMSVISFPLIDERSLVPNFNFENGDGANAYGWTYTDTSTMKKYRSTDDKHEGSYSYYTYLNSSDYAEGYSYRFTVVGGAWYNVSFWAKTVFPTTETGAGFYVALRAKNSTTEITAATSTFIAASTDWTFYSYIMQIPDDGDYTLGRIRVTMKITDNIGTGAYSFVDEVTVLPAVYSLVVSQGLVIPETSLPETVDFQAYFVNYTAVTDLTDADFKVYLDDTELTVTSCAFNTTTQLYDISVTMPIVAVGKYMLKIEYGDTFSSNFKGVNIYDTSETFTFIQLTDLHLTAFTVAAEIRLNGTLQAIQSYNPDFILYTGDMAAPQNNLNRLFNILYAIDFATPIIFVNGNHEKETANAYLTDSVRYFESNVTSFGIEYPYSFEYGNFHFTGLDTGVFPFASDGNISDAQYAWLQNDLADTGKTNIVFMHHPLYFGGVNYWSDDVVASNIMGVFESSNVTYVYSGHLHANDVSILNSVYYVTTTSASNNTVYGGVEPYGYAGFRVVNVIDGVVASYFVHQTHSYYSGNLLDANFTDVNGVPMALIGKINGVPIQAFYQ